MPTTRLAPSPTGALHLGNARTFLLTWLWARSTGARLPLRIEDIDSPRKKPGAIDQLFEDLRWLGIDWDGEPVIQSANAEAHGRALDALIDRGLAYPCVCTRKDVESQASAPHAEDELRYPGTCRGRFPSVETAFCDARRPVAMRYAAAGGAVSFADFVRGPVAIDPAQAGGDFVIARWDPEGGFQCGYQLAVVVDDAAAGVDHVIRGDDLLSSAARQILIQRALGLATPAYAHLPLVVGQDGRRLAKRHGDTRVASYRAAGIPPSEIRAWAARVSGLEAVVFDDPRHPSFDFSMIPRGPVVVPPHAAASGPPPGGA